jgi:hypothetical protein
MGRFVTRATSTNESSLSLVPVFLDNDVLSLDNGVSSSVHAQETLEGFVNTVVSVVKESLRDLFFDHRYVFVL